MSPAEIDLHAAICQAVALLNVTPELARSETGRQAHNILREALVTYADRYPMLVPSYTLSQIADACVAAEIPDSKYESIQIALESCK